MIGTARLSDTADESIPPHVWRARRSFIAARRIRSIHGRRPDDRDVDEGAIVEVTTKGFRLDLSNAQWLRTTRSGSDDDNCVEVAFVDQAIVVRDSANPQGPALIFTAAEWDAFLGGAKDGEFDL
jgi:hypothetical protein